MFWFNSDKIIINVIFFEKKLKKTIETYRESVKTKGTAINEYIQQHNLGPLIRNAVDGGGGGGGITSSAEKSNV